MAIGFCTIFRDVMILITVCSLLIELANGLLLSYWINNHGWHILMTIYHYSIISHPIIWFISNFHLILFSIHHQRCLQICIVEIAHPCICLHLIFDPLSVFFPGLCFLTDVKKLIIWLFYLFLLKLQGSAENEIFFSKI